MLKSIAKNSSIYYLSGILTKGISFFLLPLYTSILSKENYGVLELMSIVSTLMIIIFTFQINQAVARYYNELVNQKHIQIYTSTVIFFSLMSFFTFFLLFTLFNSQISAYLSLPPSTAIWAGASISLNGMFYMSQNQLTWKILPFKEMISSLVYNITTIGTTIFLLVSLNKGIEGIFIAQCFGAVAGILVAFFFTKNDYAWFFSTKILKKLFKFSFPLIPGALSIFLYMFTDRICIKEMLGLDDLGVFSIGNKIATILTFTSLGVSSALSPLFYKYHKDPEVPEKIAFLFRVFSSVSFMIMGFLAFFSKEIIHFLTTTEYSGAARVIPFMLLAVYLNSLTFFFPGLSISKKTFKISLIAISAGSLNVILNILFVPHYGILAAAVVTCLSFGLNFFLLYVYSQKEYPIKVSLVPLFIQTIFYFSLIYLSLRMNSFLLTAVLFVICSAASIFLLKKSDIRTILEKIKNFKLN